MVLYANETRTPDLNLEKMKRTPDLLLKKRKLKLQDFRKNKTLWKATYRSRSFFFFSRKKKKKLKEEMDPTRCIKTFFNKIFKTNLRVKCPLWFTDNHNKMDAQVPDNIKISERSWTKCRIQN